MPTIIIVSDCADRITDITINVRAIVSAMLGRLSASHRWTQHRGSTVLEVCNVSNIAKMWRLKMQFVVPTSQKAIRHNRNKTINFERTVKGIRPDAQKSLGYGKREHRNRVGHLRINTSKVRRHARVRKRFVCAHVSTRGIDQPMGVCHKHSAILLIHNSEVKSVTKRFALRDETNAVIHVVLNNAAL
jgi:hypothetical protein